MKLKNGSLAHRIYTFLEHNPEKSFTYDELRENFFRSKEASFKTILTELGESSFVISNNVWVDCQLTQSYKFRPLGKVCLN